MKLTYIALIVAACSALGFMLLWAQAESENAQLQNKYEMIRAVARQEQPAVPAAAPASTVVEDVSAQPEVLPALNTPVRPESKPAQTVRPVAAPVATAPVAPVATSAPAQAASAKIPTPQTLEKLKQIQQRLMLSMSTGQGRNIDEVAKIIAELQQLQQKEGLSLPGIDFTATQKNLEIAKKIQILGDEIQQSSKATPLDSQKLNAQVAEMSKLQEQIQQPLSLNLPKLNAASHANP